MNAPLSSALAASNRALGLPPPARDPLLRQPGAALPTTKEVR